MAAWKLKTDWSSVQAMMVGFNYQPLVPPRPIWPPAALCPQHLLPRLDLCCGLSANLGISGSCDCRLSRLVEEGVEQSVKI